MSAGAGEGRAGRRSGFPGTPVLLWVGLAGKMGGLALAIRAVLTFMLPLAMIWLPQLFARIASRDAKWQRDFSPPPSALVVKVLSWLVIFDVPFAWFVFGRIGKE